MTIALSASICALTLVAAGIHSAERRPVMFGDRENWLVMDASTYSVERISYPVANISNVAVSPDASQFVFIAPEPTMRDDALWVWRRGEPKAKILESQGGRYSDPVFDPDGRWIYYSHTASTGQRHMFGTYAQIFRIRPDGSGREQVTNEAGCHFGATFSGTSLAFIHSSCTGNCTLKRMRSPMAPKVIASPAGTIDEVTVSADGQTVVYVVGQPDGILLRTARAGGESKTLAELARRASRLRPAFGASDQEILFQNDGFVWLLRKGQQLALVSITEGGEAK